MLNTLCGVFKHSKTIANDALHVAMNLSHHSTFRFILFIHTNRNFFKWFYCSAKLKFKFYCRVKFMTIKYHMIYGCDIIDVKYHSVRWKFHEHVLSWPSQAMISATPVINKKHANFLLVFHLTTKLTLFLMVLLLIAPTNTLSLLFIRKFFFVLKAINYGSLALDSLININLISINNT